MPLNRLHREERFVTFHGAEDGYDPDGKRKHPPEGIGRLWHFPIVFSEKQASAGTRKVKMQLLSSRESEDH